MHTAIVTLLCVALIVFGGMVMSQGFLTSADASAISFEEISAREGDIMRTELTPDNAAMPSNDTLQLTLDNSGQTKLAAYDRWDVIVEYRDVSGHDYVKWLPYTEGSLAANSWCRSGIYLNGKAEAFEPGILNPEEEIAIEIGLDPPTGGEAASVLVSAPNGASTTVTCAPGRLVAHAETITMGGTDYFRLKGAIPADGPPLTETTQAIGSGETGRWLLYDQSDASMPACHVYPLRGISELSAATWTVCYWGQAIGNWLSPSGIPGLSMDVLIRQEDGSLRQMIATDVAEAVFTAEDEWQTLLASYEFPGYTVVNGSDYLEINYYGKSMDGGPSGSDNVIQLSVDDDTLPLSDQTRIEDVAYYQPDY